MQHTIGSKRKPQSPLVKVQAKKSRYKVSASTITPPVVTELNLYSDSEEDDDQQQQQQLHKGGIGDNDDGQSIISISSDEVDEDYQSSDDNTSEDENAAIVKGTTGKGKAKVKAKKPTNTVRPSSTPMTQELKFGDKYSKGMIYNKLRCFHNVQGQFWKKKKITPLPLDHFTDKCDMLSSWLTSLTVQPMTVSHVALAATSNAVPEDFGERIPKTNSSRITIFLNFIVFIAKVQLNWEEWISVDLLNQFNSTCIEMGFANASIKYNLEVVAAFFWYCRSKVTDSAMVRGVNLKLLIMEVYDHLRCLITTAKSLSSSDIKLKMNEDNGLERGELVPNESWTVAIKNASETVHYYMETAKKHKQDMEEWLVQVTFGTKGERWVSLQKAIFLLFEFNTYGQRTQNLVDLSFENLKKNARGQYEFQKLAIEKQQHAGKRMDVQKVLVFNTNFTKVLDFWKLMVTTVCKAKNKNRNKKYPGNTWFINLDGSPLQKASNWVLWIKEITWECVGSAMDQQFLRKNIVFYALKACTTEKQQQQVAERASHSLATAKAFYYWNNPTVESAEVDEIGNAAFGTRDSLGNIESFEEDD